MRRSLALLGPLVLLAAGSPGAQAKEPAAPADPLVVHEWGTFTSVQGADGVVLEGLQHEEEALPGFVYSRSQVRDCPLRAQGYKGLEVPAEHVTQKMETPVLYFHTKSPRRVRVRVDFVKGLITQWYPVSDLLGPPEGPCDGGPLDVSKVERSFLQWDVDLLPPAPAHAADLRPVADDDPWGFARRVDAATVRTLPRRGPGRAGPVETERFLFYRGLGSFSLPLRAEVGADGRLAFVNASPHAVAQVVALEVGEDGRTGRYDVHCGIGAGATASDLLAGRETVAWRESGLPGLRSDVEKILRGQGMNEDEARAMVATWSRSWFTSEGTRLLYVVPRPLVDALLPLHVDPAPQSIERVLVGRIECIPPAVCAEVEAAIRTLATVDAAASPAAARRTKEAAHRLARLGRFEEAHVRRVLATTKDEVVREAATARLAAR